MAYSYCPYCARALGADQVCGHCGQTPESYKPQPHHFPAGTILDRRYWVGRVLGEGGFGITYLGYDAKLERRLAIKEYYPSHIVHRTSGATEVTCYQKDREEFDKGKEQFLNEARVLAKLDSVPNIVRVLDYFPANGTAYIVMEFLEGETLKQRLKKNGPMEPEALFTLLEPLFTALERLHETGLIHRDISPDNIMLLEGTDEVKLMDFGCARDVNSGLTMTVMLKPGFAPIEQYSGSEQGAWTDVYALCATMYYSMTGKRLPNAVNRSEGDTLLPPSEHGVEITAVRETALMTGLAVARQERWQNVSDLRQALNGERTIPRESHFRKEEPQPVSKGRKPLWLIAAAAVLVLCLAAVLLIPKMGSADSGRLALEITESAPSETSPETTERAAPPARPEAAAQNILMDSTWEGDTGIFRTGVDRSQILSITFLNTLEDAPAHAADASLSENRRVLAWAERSNIENRYHLYIAGDGGVYAPEDCSDLFASMENLKEIHFGDGFFTDRVTNMNRMFSHCGNLTVLDVSGFSTSAVTNMSEMFYSCYSLGSLDVSGFDTSSVTDMSSMFYCCSALDSLDVSGFDTSLVTGMGDMFYGCESLTALDVSGFDTAAVTDMSAMFHRCGKIPMLDVSGFDTGAVTDMNHMFYGCEGLTTLDVSSFDTSKVTDMGGMFSLCTNINKLDLGSFDTSAVTTMNNMFAGCWALSELNLSSFDTSAVTDMGSMFTSCDKLSKLDLSHFDTSSVTDMSEMFSSCESLISLNISSFDTSSVTNMNSMFFYCSSLPTLDLRSFDTSSVIDMNKMFAFCESLSILDLRSFDTSAVVNMNSMFYYCASLSALDLGSFDTSSVMDMGSMFANCNGLTSLDLRSFNTGSVVNMDSMFNWCDHLVNLNLSSFDTSSVTIMSSMFYGCAKLVTLDLSSFDTASVVSMHRMFHSCYELSSLDLSSFHTGSVTDMYEMFYDCHFLNDVVIGNFDTSSVTAYTGFMRDGQTVNGQPWENYFR